VTDHEPHSPRSSAAPGNRLLTASNLLSISRAILSIPFTMVMLSSLPDKNVYGAIIIAVAALTDKLDGVLARALGQITEWGKILDPLADKIAVASVGIVLLILGRIPSWYVIVMVSRDLLILSGGVYLKASRGIVLPSNETGKWAVGIVALALFLALLGVGSPWLDIAIGGSLVLLAISLVLYGRRFAVVARK
jgi:CDP-diacylglycerol--glycerol-3-phosphate 3-phosphatidyltransferase